MAKLKSFHHAHPLHLVHMQWNKNNKTSDDEEEEEEDALFVEETKSTSFGECEMCREPIYSFQLCYYECIKCVDYYLHKFCAQLPETLENHPSHPGHNLNIMYSSGVEMRYDTCLRIQSMSYFNYHCSLYDFIMDKVCATISKQKMEHPSHPDHQLQRMLQPMLCRCHVCGNEHKGTFYLCTTCFQFYIHIDCASLPKKLWIQDTTSGTFTHSHSLTLAYSLPNLERIARFNPRCRVCDGYVKNCLWHYKCDKCWYYTHVDCATTKKDVWSTSKRIFFC